MKLSKKGIIGCFIFTPSFLWMVLYHTTLLGGVVPGEYKVNIKADTIEIGQDTWIFEDSGEFKSKGLGIESEWKDTGNDTFEIESDEQEITDIIQMNLLLIGLKPSDYTLKMKKIKISGSSKGNTIKGNIEIDSSIKVKNPVKITFKTNGSADFKGEWLQP